jgi:hypothetical protein
MRAWLLAILLSVIALAPVFLLTYYYARSYNPPEQPIGAIEFQQSQPSIFKVGCEYEIRACKVIDGNRYALCLQGGKWIEGHLTVVSKEEAGVYAVEVLNEAKPPVPTVTLLRQVGHYWIVDMKITVGGKRTSMKELLAAKGLLL